MHKNYAENILKHMKSNVYHLLGDFELRFFIPFWLNITKKDKNSYFRIEFLALLTKDIIIFPIFLSCTTSIVQFLNYYPILTIKTSCDRPCQKGETRSRVKQKHRPQWNFKLLFSQKYWNKNKYKIITQFKNFELRYLYPDISRMTLYQLFFWAYLF